MAITKVTANELTSLEVTGQFQDENGDGLALSALDIIMLSIYLANDRTQFLRASDDISADPYFVVDNDGNFTWSIRPFETEILDDAVTLGSKERHTAFFEFSWNSERDGSITDPFSTTSGSSVVNVELASHGLVVRDNVYFTTENNVGGLDLGGHYIVKSVVDSDNFTVEHQDEATATDSGGGTVNWFANGKAASFELPMHINRVDPV